MYATVAHVVTKGLRAGHKCTFLSRHAVKSSPGIHRHSTPGNNLDSHSGLVRHCSSRDVQVPAAGMQAPDQVQAVFVTVPDTDTGACSMQTLEQGAYIS
jgi:hypothetical protein